MDITAGLDRVTITSSGTVIAEHARSWGKHQVITDPDRQAAATRLRAALTAKTASSKRHADEHMVAIRALSDYNEMFGVHFYPAPVATTFEAT